MPNFLKLEIWLVITILCRMFAVNSVIMSRREKPLHYLLDSVVSSFSNLQAQMNDQCESSRIRHKEVMNEVNAWVSRRQIKVFTYKIYINTCVYV
jgi:hypothetical protein